MREDWRGGGGADGGGEACDLLGSPACVSPVCAVEHIGAKR